jgi:hypothetical protein
MNCAHCGKPFAANDMKVWQRSTIHGVLEKFCSQECAAAREPNPPPPPPAPTLGRVVLYVNLGDAEGRFKPEPHPAQVVGLNDDGTVALHILYRTGTFNMDAVPFSPTPKPGHWHWPPRV